MLLYNTNLPLSKEALEYKEKFMDLKTLINNLIIICETISNGYSPGILDIISIFVVFVGIVVIISKNPIMKSGELLSLLWDKLSNFRDSLNILVPSGNRKVTCG